MKGRMPRMMQKPPKRTGDTEAGASKLPAFMMKKDKPKKKGAIAMESSTGGY